MMVQQLANNGLLLGAGEYVGEALGTRASVFTVKYGGLGFFGLIQADTFSLFFHLLVGVVAALVILSSGSYLHRANLEGAEFYALILFATAGMGVLSSAQELLTAVIGLAIRSLARHVLA